MKRIVEFVGIGDVGVPSATLQISPLHDEDTALLLLGCQNASQSADYLQIRDATGTALACATSGGTLYAAVHSTPTLNTTNVNATTVSATRNTGYYVLTSKTISSTMVMGVCATKGDVYPVTATYIAVPSSATVFIDAIVTAFCTAGVAVASGAAYRVQAGATDAGRDVTYTTTPFSSVNMGQGEWKPEIKAGVDMVALAVCGSGNTAISWGYRITTVVLSST